MDWEDLTSQLRQIIKSKANEISQQLTGDEVSQVHDLLANIGMLEDELRSFEEIVDCAWDKVEQF